MPPYPNLRAKGLSNALICGARLLEIGHVAFADKHEWLDRHRLDRLAPLDFPSLPVETL
jgi:hypothetical protein